MSLKTVSLALASLVLFTSCGKKEGAAGGGAAGGSASGASTKINTAGSTTLQPIMTAWAQDYDGATVNVAGGGTGVGIEDLINGRCDICNASRSMKPEEKAKLKEKTGKDAEEFMVGYDALAVYVHPENPLTEISIAELTEIFKKGGATTKWEQVSTGGLSGDILPFGREASSGTYEYFQEAVIGKKTDFVAGISPMSSSAAVISQIGTVKNSIGYDGMAFKTDKVKWLKLSKAKGEPSVEPNANDARAKKYPLSRPLFLYTAGKPEGAIKTFIDWTMSDAGQAILSKTGNVSLR